MPDLTTQALPPASGSGAAKQLRKEGILPRTFGAGMVAFDSYSRIKNGENAAVAIGKAALTNAAWGLVPGGFLAMGAMAAVSMTPEIIRMTDAAKSGIRQKSSMFGGGFTQNEGQMYMQQVGLQNTTSARSTASGIMSRHARGASKSY